MLQNRVEVGNNAFAKQPRARSSYSGPYSVGEWIADRYELVSLLGFGPLGTVYKARDRQSEKWVAVKVIAGEWLADRGARQDFVSRLQGSERIVCSSIAQYLDAGCDGPRAYYVAELVDGVCLRYVVDRRCERGERFSPEEAISLALKLCQSLEALHLFASHGAIKPENVIVLADRVKLLDCGLSRALPLSAYLAAQERSAAAAGYIAPEISQGEVPGRTADIYALGRLLKEIVPHSTPYPNYQHQIFADEAVIEPPILADLVSRAMAYDLGERYSSIEALREALTGALEQLQPTSVRETLLAAHAVRNDASPSEFARWIAQESFDAYDSPTMQMIVPTLRPPERRADGLFSEEAIDAALDRLDGEPRPRPPLYLDATETGVVLDGDIAGAEPAALVEEERLTRIHAKTTGQYDAIESSDLTVSAEMIAAETAVHESTGVLPPAERVAEGEGKPLEWLYSRRTQLAAIGILFGMGAFFLWFFETREHRRVGAEGAGPSSVTLASTPAAARAPSKTTGAQQQPPVRGGATSPDERIPAVSEEGLIAIPRSPTAVKTPPNLAEMIADDLRCPVGMTIVRGATRSYCIDRFESPGRGKLPTTGLSAQAALARCRERGLRLCTAAEWIGVCAGEFPYGSEYELGRCNTEGDALMRAGSKLACRSPRGVYDLSGNAAEWVAEGFALGGHFASKGHDASCRLPLDGGLWTGFRCCSDATNKGK